MKKLLPILLLAFACSAPPAKDVGERCESDDDCEGICDPFRGCVAPSCGDGKINMAEEVCDDGGESAACDRDCTPAECGDGVINYEAGETCEAGEVGCQFCILPTPPTRFSYGSEIWRVPNLTSGDKVFDLSDARHGSIDINGDGRLDIVNTSGQTSLSPFGTAGSFYWEVYLGGADGFAESPIQWSVPTSPFGGYHSFGTLHSNNNFDAWRTMDATGDGLPDLLHTTGNVSSQPWVGSGGAHWRAYSNTGQGFDADFFEWEVPNIVATTTGRGFYAVDSPWWTVRDFTGDGAVDLIRFGDGATGPFYVNGESYWELYVGTGTGFEVVPAKWRLPDVVAGSPRFESLTSPWHAVVDMNNDGLLDFVHTSEGDSAWLPFWDPATDHHWRVYLSNGSSFSQQHTPWLVPALELPYLSYGRWRGMPMWEMHDINFDGYPDLVSGLENTIGSGCEQAGNCLPWGPSAGNRHWRVHYGGIGGFGAAVRFPLPVIPEVGVFENFYRPSFRDTISDDHRANLRWQLIDINGDRSLDLVQTSDPSQPSLQPWSANGMYDFWRVYLGVTD